MAFVFQWSLSHASTAQLQPSSASKLCHCKCSTHIFFLAFWFIQHILFACSKSCSFTVPYRVSSEVFRFSKQLRRFYCLIVSVMWRLPQMGNLRLGKTGVINLGNGEHKTQTRFYDFTCRPTFSLHLLVSVGQTRAFSGNMICVLQHLFFPCLNPPALRVPPSTIAPVNHRNRHKWRSHQRSPLVPQLQWLTLCSMIPLRLVSLQILSKATERHGCLHLCPSPISYYEVLGKINFELCFPS